MQTINLEDLRHGIRVANYSLELAIEIRLSKHKTQNVYIAGLFHDIGKAHLNQDILNKPKKLTETERLHINKHPFYSYKEVLKMGYPEDIALDILHHHENWNGTGYPKGLKEEAIPVGARILKISDVFDALTMQRPYRKKLTIREALKIMDGEISNYDPELYLLFSRYLYGKYEDNIIRPSFPSVAQIMQIHNRTIYLEKEI